VWDFEMTSGQSIDLDLPPTDSICVRSVCRNAQVRPRLTSDRRAARCHVERSFQGKVLVGLKTSDIIEIDQKSADGKGKARALVFGHGEGQLWALSPHPTKAMFATGSYDCNLVVWDISSKVSG
jgi:hypothetical protein